MSTAIMSAFMDYSTEVNILRNNNILIAQKSHYLKSSNGDKKIASSLSVARRNSTATCMNNHNNNNKLANSVISLHESGLSNAGHRKLDRSYSEPVDRQQRGTGVVQSNSSRYKTELCRPYEESGKCKYGDKCQFAHGGHELRTLARHPKYKTELCRTFHTIGFCPYGPRCHFIHNGNGDSPAASPSASPTSSSTLPMVLQVLNNLQDPHSPGNSPTALDCFGFDDALSYSPPASATPSPPSSSGTANSAFTFSAAQIQDYPQGSPPPISKRVQQQNAYNRALNQYSVSVYKYTRSESGECVSSGFRETTPMISIPGMDPASPPESDLDNMSVSSSPPGPGSPPMLVDKRLPIFNRLGIRED